MTVALVYIERRPTIAASLLNLVWLWRAPDVETSLAQIPISSTSPSHQRSSVPDSGCCVGGLWPSEDERKPPARVTTLGISRVKRPKATHRAATVWRRSSAVRAGCMDGSCVWGSYSPIHRPGSSGMALAGGDNVFSRIPTVSGAVRIIHRASSHGRCYRALKALLAMHRASNPRKSVRSRLGAPSRPDAREARERSAKPTTRVQIPLGPPRLQSLKPSGTNRNAPTEGRGVPETGLQADPDLELKSSTNPEAHNQTRSEKVTVMTSPDGSLADIDSGGDRAKGLATSRQACWRNVDKRKDKGHQ